MFKKFTLILLLAVAPSQATLITVTSVDWTRGGMTTFLADGVEETGFAGVINATYEGSALPFFCVDLFTGISYGDYSSTPVFPRPWHNEDRAAWLYLHALPTVTTAVQGQALQLAIWDIVHDNGDGFTLGRIQQSINSDLQVIQAASDYLNLSLNGSSMAAAIFFNAVIGKGAPAQAFLGALQVNTQTQVPNSSARGVFRIADGVGRLGVDGCRARSPGLRCLPICRRLLSAFTLVAFRVK